MSGVWSVGDLDAEEGGAVNYTPVVASLILSLTCANATVDHSGGSAGGSHGPLKVKPTHQHLPAFEVAS